MAALAAWHMHKLVELVHRRDDNPKTQDRILVYSQKYFNAFSKENNYL
jgi:hypothetical protein